MQSRDGSSWWSADGSWPTGRVLHGAGLGAGAHLERAAALLAQAEPVQWRAAAAREFAGRVAEIAAQVRALTALAAVADVEVAALEAALAAARAALPAGPWWAAR